MGCFDSVMFKCPRCGEEMEAQTKNGPCIQNYYDADTEEVPFDIAVGVNGDTVTCYSCYYDYAIQVEGLQPPPTYKVSIKEIGYKPRYLAP